MTAAQFKPRTRVGQCGEPIPGSRVTAVGEAAVILSSSSHAHGAEYTAGGVRPSPGAAIAEGQSGMNCSVAFGSSEVAAPGDGRTPVLKGGTRPRKLFAFTLIELLVVIAIISLLAAMIFPITKALNRTKLRTRAKGELALLQTAIESYKSKIGVYPPDNPNNKLIAPLYYELLGTVLTNSGSGPVFRTLDGSSELPAESSLLPSVFLGNVRGFANTARPGGGDEASSGGNFLPSGLPPNQIGQITNNGVGLRLIVSSVKWPLNDDYQPVPSVKGLNPWRYNSSNPTNNPNAYDLWLDFIVDGKTNRVSNWSKEVLVP